MRSICVVGPTYEQTYPQKLGRGCSGINILDSSRENAVSKPDFYLSNIFLGDKSGIGKYFAPGGEKLLLLAGLFILGLRKRGNREDCTQGSLEFVKWSLIRFRPSGGFCATSDLSISHFIKVGLHHCQKNLLN